MMNVQIADDETKLSLPIDLVEEIFSRLPVKLLLQLRCMCKRWNSLISDPKFIKKHLQMAKASQNHHHLMLQNNGFASTHITSIFTTRSPSQTPLPLPHNLNTDDFSKCSGYCHGILCFTIRDSYPVLWNPSNRQYSVIPPVKNSFPPPENYGLYKVTPETRRMSFQANFYSFGYDNTTHKYKIVAISFIRNPPTPKTSIYTLGSDPTDCSWRGIHDFPECRSRHTLPKSGLFLSGTVNWLAGGIFSLDLATETYQKLLLPTTSEVGSLTLGVLKDFLCIFDCNNRVTDIWMMMEFGNNESWHILYTIPSIADQHPFAKVLYISEDEQFLMLHNKRQCQLGVYRSRNYTSEILELQHRAYMDPVVYTESLILPCSLATVNQ